MLQWMGGARKRINVSKNSLQRRQKQSFEQRKQDRSGQAADGASALPNGDDPRACREKALTSLDIQCLRRLCEDVPATSKGPLPKIEAPGKFGGKKQEGAAHADAGASVLQSAKRSHRAVPGSPKRCATLKNNCESPRTPTPSGAGKLVERSDRPRKHATSKALPPLCVRRDGRKLASLIAEEDATEVDLPHGPESGTGAHGFFFQNQPPLEAALPGTGELTTWNSNFQDPLASASLRPKPLLPHLLQEVGSRLNLSDGKGGFQFQRQEAESLLDLSYDAFKHMSPLGGELLLGESHGCTPYSQAGAERVTCSFGDMIMWEPVSYQSPRCFDELFDASIDHKGSPFCFEDEDHNKPCDLSKATSFNQALEFGGKSGRSGYNMDLDEARSEYSGALQQGPLVTSSIRSQMEHSIPFVNSYPWEDCRDPHWPDWGENALEERFYSISDALLRGDGLSPEVPFLELPAFLGNKELDLGCAAAGDLILQQSSAFVRHQFGCPPWQATENVKEASKKANVHDASSSSKDSYFVGPLSPVSHVQQEAQEYYEPFKRQKHDPSRDLTENFWGDQGNCKPFKSSPETMHKTREQDMEDSPTIWTEFSPKAASQNRKISGSLQFVPPADELSNTIPVSICSSKTVPVHDEKNNLRSPHPFTKDSEKEKFNGVYNRSQIHSERRHSRRSSPTKEELPGQTRHRMFSHADEAMLELDDLEVNTPPGRTTRRKLEDYMVKSSGRTGRETKEGPKRAPGNSHDFSRQLGDATVKQGSPGLSRGAETPKPGAILPRTSRSSSGVRLRQKTSISDSRLKEPAGVLNRPLGKIKKEREKSKLVRSTDRKTKQERERAPDGKHISTAPELLDRACPSQVTENYKPTCPYPPGLATALAKLCPHPELTSTLQTFTKPALQNLLEGPGNDSKTSTEKGRLPLTRNLQQPPKCSQSSDVDAGRDSQLPNHQSARSAVGRRHPSPIPPADPKYVGMLESYIVQLKLVNRVLQE